MNPLLIWNHGFLGWVLRASWQASLLAILVLGVQWLLRKHLSSGWKYGLWMLVIVRLLLPLSFESAFSIFNLAPNQFSRQRAPSVAPGSAATPPISLTPAPVYWKMTVEPVETRRVPEAVPDVQKTFRGEQKFTVRRVKTNSEWFSRNLWWFWGVGALLQLTRLVFQNLRFSKLLRRADQVANSDLIEVLEACRRAMNVRRRLVLVETEALQSPALYGFWRPKLLLPLGMSQTFSPEEMRFVFLHELAHLKRYDMLVNWIVCGLEVLYWFNPILWFCFARMRVDRELATDAFVLGYLGEGENKSYGDTIIKILAELNGPMSAPSLIGILEDKRQMVQRIRMIAGFKRARWSAWTLVIFAGLAFISLTDAQPEKSKENSKQQPDAAARLAPGQATPKQVENSVYDLIKNARILIELGNLPEAEVALTEALRQRPGEPNATYYLNLVNEAWSAQSARKAEVQAKFISASDDTTSRVDGRESKSYSPIQTQEPEHSERKVAPSTIEQKLRTIVLNEIFYDNLPLTEVIRNLNESVRHRDPDGHGINFILDPGAPPKVSTNRTPVTDGNGHTFDLDGAAVESFENTRIRLHLKNARLRDVIDAIALTGDVPIQYTVLPYAVVFSPRKLVSPQLFTRVYRVDPNRFLEGVLRTPSTVQFGAGTNVIDLVLSTLRALGVDASTNGKAVFFNDRTGLLLVRAEMEDLDTIEKAINVFNTTPPQVSIEAKLVSIPRASQDALDFDWFLSNSLMKSSKPVANENPLPGAEDKESTGTPDFGDLPKSGKPAKTGAAMRGRPSTITGILTDPQFRAVIHALDQRNDVKTVLAPRVTTLSGRQARLELVQPHGGGCSLDTVVTVGADGYSIHTQVDFVWRRDSDGNETLPTNSSDQTNPPLRLTTEAVVWDGQALVLGPFPVQERRVQGSKEPESNEILMLFITPTIIDPAGNRVHPE